MGSTSLFKSDVADTKVAAYDTSAPIFPLEPDDPDEEAESEAPGPHNPGPTPNVFESTSG